MEQHYKNFVTTLYTFMEALNRYYPNENIQKFISVYDKLDISKVIFKIAIVTKEHQVFITEKNSQMFNQSCFILPEIDLSAHWQKLSTGQKNKVWTYLQILSIESEFLINYDKSKTTTSTSIPLNPPPMPEETSVQSSTTATTVTKSPEEPAVKKPLEFNPYVGIGSNDQSYGVEDMYSANPSLAEDKPSAPGIGSVISMLGVDKMINMEDLSNQLKNMKKEDIDTATNTIRSFLGPNVDENTTTLISDMLTGITTELKLKDLSNGDPLSNIMKIAETVATKMQPQMIEKGIDMSALLNSTQNLANQCKDDKGNPIFGGENNPFSMLSQLTNTLNGSMSENMTEDQYIKNCNDMLKNMGMEGVDMANMDLSKLTGQLQNKMQSQMKSVDKKSTKSKKNKNKKK